MEELGLLTLEKSPGRTSSVFEDLKGSFGEDGGSLVTS